jgi:hypothetical protein
MNWTVNHEGTFHEQDSGGNRMVDLLSYVMITVVTFCFGLLVSFQIAHIYYVRRLTKLAKRSLDTGTIAPILVELEELRKS